MAKKDGKMMHQTQRYDANVPKKLPPDPPLRYTDEIQSLLSDADRLIGKLDGMAQTLTNPELFAEMYIKKEALLSSQIEGSQASFMDVVSLDDEQSRKKAEEVTNYSTVMKQGLKRLKESPMDLPLIREIHSELLWDGRSYQNFPGDYGTIPDCIGATRRTDNADTFLPPPEAEIKQALRDLERFMHADDKIPPLIKIGLIHAQFQTIHPFMDGNGRMGRMLIPLWLSQQKILSKPLLYLSYYFKKNRLEYFDHLINIRLHCGWEGWIQFFLQGICEVSDEVILATKQINMLREECRQKLITSGSSVHKNSLALFDYLFVYPMITKQQVMELLDISLPTVTSLVDQFLQVGILEDYSADRKRKKRYGFTRYIQILERGTELE